MAKSDFIRPIYKLCKSIKWYSNNYENMEDPRIFDLKGFKSIPNYLGYFIGISYFFGFIVINSHLSKYNFYSINLLSIDYLVAGILFSVIFGILLFSIYFSNKNHTETSEDIYDFYIPALSRILIIMYAVSFLTMRQEDLTKHELLTINLIGLFYIPFVSILNSSYIVKNMRRSNRWLISLFYVFLANVFIFVKCESCRSLMVLCFVAGIGILIVLSDILDKKYQKVQAIGTILTIIIFSSIFGYSTYERIPKKFGGGKPYKAQLIIEKNQIAEIGKFLKIDSIHTAEAEIIFETSDEFLLRQDRTSLILSKTLFIGQKKID